MKLSEIFRKSLEGIGITEPQETEMEKEHRTAILDSSLEDLCTKNFEHFKDPESPDYCNILRTVVARYGLNDVRFKLVTFSRAGALYGADKTIYIHKNCYGSHQFPIIMHELGHAYRDIHNGPIYNYYLLKSISGEPMDPKACAEAISNEEREACAWSTKVMGEFGLKNPITNSDRGSDTYLAYLSGMDYSKLKTVEDLTAYFLRIGGYQG